MKTKTKFKLSTVWCHKSFRLTASLLHSSSSLSFSDCNCQRPYGTSPCFQLFESYEEITSYVVNKILGNQQVSISQEDLDKLKGIPGVNFYLPLNDETFFEFVNLVGKQRSQKSGVYIFTHLESGSKYIGSSNNLSYRLSNYFRHEDNKRNNTGLMISMLREKGWLLVWKYLSYLLSFLQILTYF